MEVAQIKPVDRCTSCGEPQASAAKGSIRVMAPCPQCDLLIAIAIEKGEQTAPLRGYAKTTVPHCLHLWRHTCGQCGHVWLEA